MLISKRLLDVSVIGIIPSISIIVMTVSVIGITYIFILITILKMHSTEGRHKAFSTSISHLTAVITLYYGTITFIYMIPKSNDSTEQNKVLSVFHTVVIHMLNPLIYSLRNRDVKDVLRKATVKVYS
ncbi:olfactory receptor [Cricetulus griseus]|uniref:Olfactory receptor n=1 Tax=Cricetulus griseus TaxID=10029 RepID=A0A061HX53_CRIGR|nr:olfactory receptor [Cricetulus griseus]